jgi:hypothetical protein
MREPLRDVAHDADTGGIDDRDVQHTHGDHRQRSGHLLASLQFERSTRP